MIAEIAINKGTAGITLLLLTMFYWINKRINESDEVWRWVNLKYGMSWIIQKLHSTKKITSLTSLLLTMFNWTGKTVNESDEVWRWLHRKYGMSRIIRILHSIKNQLILPWYYQRCLIESTKQWMRVMKYVGKCIKIMEWVE